MATLDSGDQDSVASVEAEVVAPSTAGTYRIAILGRDSGAWFTWRRAYVYNPDFHPPDYDPRAAARADLAAAAQEYPGREMAVEKLVDNHDETYTEVTNPDGSIAQMSNNDATHSWVPVDEEG